MNEKEYTGSAGRFRASDFVDAVEDLSGYTRKKPLEIEIEKAVLCSGVINNDGKKENNVFAVALKGVKRRMRVNATKRKMLVKASGTSKAAYWKGLKLRLYQTVDSNRATGGKTSISAIAMDVKQVGVGDEWLRYLDYQQQKGRNHVMNSGLADEGLV